MASPKTRGISLVRYTKVFEPKRKEFLLEPRQFMVRCNAAIPFSHKAFQNQYLYVREEEEEKPKKPTNNKKQK